MFLLAILEIPANFDFWLPLMCCSSVFFGMEKLRISLLAEVLCEVHPFSAFKIQIGHNLHKFIHLRGLVVSWPCILILLGSSIITFTGCFSMPLGSLGETQLFLSSARQNSGGWSQRVLEKNRRKSKDKGKFFFQSTIV